MKDRVGKEIKVDDVFVAHEIKNDPNDGLTTDVYYGELGLVEEIEEDSSELCILASIVDGKAWFRGSEIEVLQSAEASLES